MMNITRHCIHISALIARYDICRGAFKRGGGGLEGGPSPPHPHLESKFHFFFFLQTYYEINKGCTTCTCTLNRYFAKLSVLNVQYCFLLIA